MSVPTRAPVRPRFRSPDSGEILLLEEAVRDRVESGQDTLIWLTGGPGSGKTTALDHLRACFAGDGRLICLDGPELSRESQAEIDRQVDIRCAVLATKQPQDRPPSQVWQLAPWGRDELIEYLLAVHPHRCAGVMQRITDKDLRLAGGIPELWRIALDQLAADETVPDFQAALVRWIQQEASRPDRWRRALQIGWVAFLSDGEGLDAAISQDWMLLARGAFRLLRHQPVQLFLATEFLVEQLTQTRGPPPLAQPLPVPLITSAADRLRGRIDAWDVLHTAMKDPEHQAMAASLLHALDHDWQPASGGHLNLRRAQLQGVNWPQLDLRQCRADRARLAHANLEGVNWERGGANGSDLRQADLSGANLTSWDARGANLSGCNLTSVFAGSARFRGAVLEHTKFCDADLSESGFRETTLRNAAFQRAKLCGADFRTATLEDCAFQDADLCDALLNRLDLRACLWNGALLCRAQLIGCNLEETDLADVDFTAAQLTGALFTASTLRRCRLDDAILHVAGLADVDWEGVSLRGADLRGASFHLGSSRSGLVGAPIACEGSRTGFYTDEFQEQDYRSPEEIRKANLRFADLRGAKIGGVDFYLVDLRDALYDPEHREYFRRCGAILEDRCSA